MGVFIISNELVKEVDYKRKYFNLVKSLIAMEKNMHSRCPSLVRNCCFGCNLIRLKLKDIRSGFDSEDGSFWEEVNK